MSGRGGLWSRAWNAVQDWWQGDGAEDASTLWTPVTSSVEIFARPGHGRSSFLWSSLYMLRQLSRVWGGYVCWPRDEATAEALREVHEAQRSGALPPRFEGEDCPPRYDLDLRNLQPGLDRHLVLWDAGDPLFTADRLRCHEVDWNLPALWLVSLSDRTGNHGEFLDLDLDRMVRARQDALGTCPETPFRVVMVLTKGDEVPGLPREIRERLRDDPLALALTSETPAWQPRGDSVELPVPARRVGDLFDGDPVTAYFRSRNDIHELTREWLYMSSSGRSLIGRAQELGVELRFSVVSATGGGFGDGCRLAMAWQPRRILDPFFWALESSDRESSA